MMTPMRCETCSDPDSTDLCPEGQVLLDRLNRTSNSNGAHHVLHDIIEHFTGVRPVIENRGDQWTPS